MKHAFRKLEDADHSEDKHYKVDYFFFNMWSLNFKKRIQAVGEGKDPDSADRISEYELSQIIRHLFQNYPLQIESFISVRKLTDYMFKKTKVFYSLILLLYSLCLLLFILQLGAITGSSVKTLNIIQLFIQVLLFCIELI